MQRVGWVFVNEREWLVPKGPEKQNPEQESHEQVTLMEIFPSTSTAPVRELFQTGSPKK